MTREPSSENLASFSSDGRSIYFSSDRSGRREIWRMPADGGPAVQVTRSGVSGAQESWDGQYLYLRSADSPVVRRAPVGGRGEELAVLRLPSLGAWVLSESGIYYNSSQWLLRARRSESSVSFLDLESRRTLTLLKREGAYLPLGLAVSPDEQWILQSLAFQVQSELMLVENFR